jgi:hypothetical protein
MLGISLVESANEAGSHPSKLNVSNGEKRGTAVQLYLPVTASQEFLSGSPERSLPLLVHFGHSSVPGTRKRSLN